MSLLDTKKLKKLIKARKYTHKRFAYIIGVSKSCMDHWCQGHRMPKIEYIILMAQVLKLDTVDELLKYDKNVFLNPDKKN